MTPRKFPVKPVLILNLLAVLALLVYFNNAKRFNRKPSAAARGASAPAFKTAQAPAPAAGDVPDAASGTGTERRYRSDLSPVLCRARDTVPYIIKAGLTLVYTDPALAAEIREKEEGLRTLIRYVFADKAITQIEAERCRGEILEKANRFLSRGRVEDVVFNAFDIVPAAPDAHRTAADTPAKETP